MFGFIKKAAKKVSGAVKGTAKALDPEEIVRGRGIVRGGLTLGKGAVLAAAPAAVVTSYAVRHPVKAAAVVATAGAAAPSAAASSKGSTVTRVVTLGAQGAGLKAGGGGGQKYLPALAQAHSLLRVARGGSRPERLAALKLVRNTVGAAKRGDRKAAVAARLLQVANQEESFARTGRVRIGRWYLTRGGRVHSA